MYTDKLPPRLSRLFWVLSILVLFAPALGCTDNDTEPAPEEPASGKLLSSTLIGEFTAQQLATRVSTTPVIGSLARYSVRAYRLTYVTRNPNNEVVTASGALLVPVVPAGQTLPLLSYQHGTIRPADEATAPSYYSTSSEVYSAVSVMASSGYLIAAPDYIGYGASKTQLHPYEHAATLGSTSLDMLRATREFAQQQQVGLNGKTFLAGYSEGGYATMALLKLIETDPASGFTVTACAPGAGAYNKTAFAQYIMTSTQPLNFLSTYVWVLYSYNWIYGMNRPTSYFYNEPYATQLAANTFAPVPTQASALFTPALRASVINRTDSAMVRSLRANDIYNWRPRAPLALFHGTADDFVPFFNSQNAYDAMRARGATQVELRPIQGGDHYSSTLPYTLQAYLYFSQF